jgi:hypothetical protein
MVLELYCRKAGEKRKGRKKERPAMAKRRERGKRAREERLESKKDRVRGRESKRARGDEGRRGETRGGEGRGGEGRGEERRGEERRGERGRERMPELTGSLFSLFILSGTVMHWMVYPDSEFVLRLLICLLEHPCNHTLMPTILVC